MTAMTKSNENLFPWLLVFYEIAIYLSMDAYMPALPHIATVFHVDASIAQWTSIIWMVGALVPQLFLGPLSDRYGRRPIILYGGVIYMIASLLCAVAPTINLFLLARLLQGLAMPTMFIAGYAAVNEWFSTSKAISILARMNAVTILAPAFGPMLGGVFLLRYNWRWIFVILGGWALLSIAMLWRYMPETLAPAKRSPSLCLPTSLRHYKRVCTNIRFMMASCIAFLPTIGLIVWMLAGPFVVMNQFHYSTLDFGLLQGIIFAGFIVGTKLVSRFADANRHRLFIQSGLLLALAAAVLATVFGWWMPHGMMLLVAFMTLASLGAGMVIPILSRLTLDTSDEPMGIKVTVFSIMRVAVSGLLGSIAVAVFYNHTLLSLALLMLVFNAVAMVLWWFTRGSLCVSADA